MTIAVKAPTRDDRAAVDKAFSLLTAFGDRGRSGIGVSELARRANLSKSTAFRVLGMLERNSMVEKVGTRYRLGVRLHELGRSMYTPEHERIRDHLLPFLTDLFRITEHTVHLGVLDATDVFYLAKLYGHRSVWAPSRIGGRLPAHCTALGKVLLAYDHAATVEAISLPLASLTPHSVTDPTALEAELGDIRRTGIAVEREESRLNVNCIAAPIFSRSGQMCAAMSVAAPAGTDLHPLEVRLRRVCASAGQHLGRRGATTSAS